MDQPISRRAAICVPRYGKIIRREDADGWRSGQQCVDDARREADALRAAATERGYSEGRERAEEERVQLMVEATIRRDRYLSAIEEELVGVVVNAMRKIFAEFSDVETCRIVIRKALTALRHRTLATVRVHPSQFDAIRSDADVLVAGLGNPVPLVIESDSRINPGSCVVSSDAGLIETDLETQIRTIEQVLRKSVDSR